MTRQFFTTILICCICFALKAESFSWAIQTNDNYAICSDASGNVYTTGGVPVIKYDAAGHELMRISSNDTIIGESINTDSQGYIYVAGRFSGSLTFGALNVSSNGKTDVFLAKFSPSGNAVWLQAGGGADYDDCQAMDMDAEGNILITGTYVKSAHFGGFFFSGEEYKDVFVLSYDNNGSLQWAQSINGTSGPGGSDFTSVNGIAALPGGACIISGYFSGSMVVAGKKYVPSGSYDGFIAKLTGIAAASFVKTYPTAHISSIKTDTKGDIFIGGSFFQSTDIGSVHLAVDSTFASNMLLARLDASANVIWAKKAGGNYDDGINDMVLDAQDNIYFTGFFSRMSTFGNTHLTAVGENDFIAGKYDGDGNKLWVMGAGNTGEDAGIGICLNNTGDKLYAIGVVQYGDVNFGGTVLQNPNGFAFLTAISEISAGIKESVQGRFDLNAYPNPSPGAVTFSIEREPGINAVLELYDITGKRILSRHVSGRMIRIEDLSPGIYIATYHDGETVMKQKLVIQ